MNNKSLNYRRDTRTEEQFKQDIKKRTVKERFLARLIADELTFRGHTVTLENHGIDNTGQFIEGKTTCDPDYEITIDLDKTILADVKNSGTNKKCTFKVHQLKQYVKCGACLILFYGTGFIDDDLTAIDYKATRWALVRPHEIRAMLDQLTVYKDPKFGYKPCVQILAKDFDKFFKSHKLESKTQ